MIKRFREEIVLRFSRNFLDILVLRLIQAESMWGYKIIRKTEALFGIKLRHGAIYPLLNSLEAAGLLQSRRETHGKRERKVYQVTAKGMQYVNTYYGVLKEQLQAEDLKGTKQEMQD
ncbi:MAG: PadR family transcriptional regulator [Candidatus Bathyarchaeota archaeon]|nr:MAG: PadR family transcriptional regulator [Candidatus Bathyarchaeota archaeon]